MFESIFALLDVLEAVIFRVVTIVIVLGSVYLAFYMMYQVLRRQRANWGVLVYMAAVLVIGLTMLEWLPTWNTQALRRGLERAAPERALLQDLLEDQWGIREMFSDIEGDPYPLPTPTPTAPPTETPRPTETPAPTQTLPAVEPPPTVTPAGDQGWPPAPPPPLTATPVPGG